MATGAIGAVILGEYEFTGTTPWLAGVVFGLLISEVSLSVAPARAWWLAVAGGAVAAGSLLWAGWITSGEGVAPYPAMAWVAAGLGAASATWRARPRAAPLSTGEDPSAEAPVIDHPIED